MKMKMITTLLGAICGLMLVLSPVTANEKPFFKNLEITDIKLSGHKIHIKGNSDLPEGAQLHLDFHAPWLNTSEGNKKTIKVRVNSNNFFVMIDIPKDKKIKDLRGTSILFKIFFRPSLQDDDIKLKVGAKGEHLKGEHLAVADGEKILTDSKKFLF